MLIIVPIMLCCTAQKFTYYAQIMPNYLCLSSHALLIISSLWINYSGWSTNLLVKMHITEKIDIL